VVFISSCAVVQDQVPIKLATASEKFPNVCVDKGARMGISEPIEQIDPHDWPIGERIPALVYNLIVHFVNKLTIF